MPPHRIGDLLESIKSILRMFIKSETIKACYNLTKIDLNNKEISKSKENWKKNIISVDVKEFKLQHIKVVISAAEKLLKDVH